MERSRSRSSNWRCGSPSQSPDRPKRRRPHPHRSVVVVIVTGGHPSPLASSSYARFNLDYSDVNTEGVGLEPTQAFT